MRGSCLFVIFLAVSLLLAGCLVYFFSDDKRDTGNSLWISSASLLGLVIFYEMLGKLWEYKARTVKKGSFPDRRNCILTAMATAYVYLILTFWFCLAWIIQVLFYYSFGLCVSEKTRRVISGNIFRYQFFPVWANPFWKIKYVGKKRKLPNGAIVMSNHLTFADPFISSSILWPYETKYIATGWIQKLPVAGGLFTRAGDLAIKFVKQADGKKKVDKVAITSVKEKAVKYIEGGENIFVFPEGTRSSTGELKEFKGNAMFNLAIEKQAYIIPMAMWGTQSLWLHGTWTPQPGYAEVTIGDPIPIGNHMELEEVKQMVRDAIINLRNSLPLYKATKGNQVDDNNVASHVVGITTVSSDNNDSANADELASTEKGVTNPMFASQTD